MPKLGLTMTEGLLASWNVKPGDTVKKGDVLFVVETEKIANEVEAQADGRIEEIAVSEGATVPVGAVVARWTGPSEIAEAGAEGQAPPAAPAAPQARAPAPADTAERIIATPLARRLARDAGFDLASVAGSGPRGRIKAADVEAALEAEVGKPAERAQAKPPAPAEAKPAPPPSSPPPAAATRRPATSVEKVVARRLTASKQAIPHFYVLAEADLTAALTLRQELNAIGGFARISVNHLVVAAVGRALVRAPEMNVLWRDEEVVTLPDPDVGIAVDTPRGLLVPVLRNAGAITLDAVAKGAADLVERAREGRLRAEDVQGGAISVSNVGMFGASYLAPIIDPDQSAILGVGALKPVFRPDANGVPVLRQEVGLVLSCDHRVFDGVKAARFLDHVKTLLEQPLLLLRG